LFDFPFEDRRKLTRWSDLATALPKSMIYDSEEQRLAELGEYADYFTRLWNERVNAEPRSDLISMMAHSDATRHMDRNNQSARQPYSPDRRRQRYHAQLDDGLGARTEREPR
jgi:cytochrome P450